MDTLSCGCMNNLVIALSVTIFLWIILKRKFIPHQHIAVNIHIIPHIAERFVGTVRANAILKLLLTYLSFASSTC